MITFEVHPEIHVRELRDHPSFSTCSECHRSFHAKSEAVRSVAPLSSLWRLPGCTRSSPFQG